MPESEQACCGGTAKKTVSGLFDRGYRRNRAAPLAVEGRELIGVDGLAARFSLDLEQDRIRAVNFRVTTCITLIAYCELIVETVAGQGAREAATLTETDLLEALPDVPLLKRDRAALAIDAFRAALAAALPSQTGEAA